MTELTIPDLKPTQPSLLVLAGYGNPIEWVAWRTKLEGLGYLCPIETKYADADAWRQRAILQQCSVALLIGLQLPFWREKGQYPILAEQLQYGVARVADMVLTLLENNKTALLLKNRRGPHNVLVSL
jgi:hypothetical protein